MSRLSKTPQDLLAELGIPSEPGSLFEQALTHRSFAYEGPGATPHNERLEFLGDAVLGAAMADLLYRGQPQLSEGEMTQIRAALVGSVGLAKVARSVGLGEHLRLSRGEEATGGRDKDSLLADALEALIGALYLARGMQAVADFVEVIFGPAVLAALEGQGDNYKGLLQEELVRRLGERPRYEVDAYGPEHGKRFTARVYVRDELWGAGNGRSKKEAEQEAAGEALARIDEPEMSSSTFGEGPDARAS